MFRPSIQRVEVLIVLAVFNLLVYYWAAGSTVIQKSRGYEIKIKASKLMNQAMLTLKESRIGESGIVFEDNPNDPNETMLVGSEYTLITTDRGDLESKLTTLNPNFAAMVVDMFLAAGLKQGDTVAVACTGSMPGANLAVFSACEVMDIVPVIITSVGASTWGATDPYFTWLDMESILVEKKLFSFRSIAASIGGGGDYGRGLPQRGRELLWESIYRNNLPLIQEDRLSQSIEKRINLYSSATPLSKYELFVNVGGGAASVGSRNNVKLITPGLTSLQNLRGLLSECVIQRFADVNVPLVHLLYIDKLVEKYQIPFAPFPMPEIGHGQLFATVEFDRAISGIALLLSIASLFWVGFKSHQQIKRNMVSYEPDDTL